MAKVLFQRGNLNYVGRNGMGIMKGLAINRYGQCLDLGPINSCGNIARCSMDLPLENVTEVIDALNAEAFPKPGTEFSKRLDPPRLERIRRAIQDTLPEGTAKPTKVDDLLLQIVQELRPDLLV